MDLYKKSIEFLLSKNLYDYPPRYKTPNEVSLIRNFHYVTDVFGEVRKMNTIESGNKYFNLI
jgi:hypothetical protein